MTVVFAFLIAVQTALAHGATAVQVPPADIVAIYSVQDPALSPIVAIVEYEAPDCGRFDDEPCYVIVHADMTTEVGP